MSVKIKLTFCEIQRIYLKFFFFFTHGKKHGSEMIQVFNNIFDNFHNSEEKC